MTNEGPQLYIAFGHAAGESIEHALVVPDLKASRLAATLTRTGR